jgi:thiol-disulfide isomerase/thioredoxin
MLKTQHALWIATLILATQCFAAEDEYRGSLNPDLRTSLPWSAGRLAPATKQDIAMLPTPPPENSRVFAGKILAVKPGGIPAVFILSPGKDSAVYIDANLNGHFEAEERFPITPDRKSQASTDGALQVDFHQPCGPQPSTPVAVRVWESGQTWFMMNTTRVMVSGSVNIASKSRLVEYAVSCPSGTVDPRIGWQGIDLNGDGKVDNGVFSPESATADHETIVLRVGSVYVSTESVDLKTRQIVLRSHPATDYQRIELETGSILRDFAFKDADGNDHHLGEFRGRYVLLDFWASWCGPCLADMPRLKAVYDHFSRPDFEILGMNNDDNADLDKARNIVQEKQAVWTHAMGSEAQNLIRKGFRIVPYPTKILLDKEGRIVTINGSGQLPVDGDNLTATLEKCGLKAN